MITGAVKSDEGRIRLKVKGLRGRQHEVEAVIDSGVYGVPHFTPRHSCRFGSALAECGPLHAGRRERVHFRRVCGEGGMGRQDAHGPRK
jgi:hypothetical protein